MLVICWYQSYPSSYTIFNTSNRSIGELSVLIPMMLVLFVSASHDGTMCCNLAYMGPGSSRYISWYTGGDLGLEIIYFSLHLLYGYLFYSSIVIALLVLVLFSFYMDIFLLVVCHLMVYIITKLNICMVLYLITIHESDDFVSYFWDISTSSTATKYSWSSASSTMYYRLSSSISSSASPFPHFLYYSGWNYSCWIFDIHFCPEILQCLTKGVVNWSIWYLYFDRLFD